MAAYSYGHNEYAVGWYGYNNSYGVPSGPNNTSTSTYPPAPAPVPGQHATAFPTPALPVAAPPKAVQPPPPPPPTLPQKTAAGFYCSVCDLNIPNDALMQFHVEGKKHRDNVRREKAKKRVPVQQQKQEPVESVIDNVVETQQRAKLQDRIEANALPIIGANFVDEILRGSEEIRYHCNLCNFTADPDHPIVTHLTGYKHRYNFFKDSRPQYFRSIENCERNNDKTNMNAFIDRYTNEIFQTEGCGFVVQKQSMSVEEPEETTPKTTPKRKSGNPSSAVVKRRCPDDMIPASSLSGTGGIVVQPQHAAVGQDRTRSLLSSLDEQEQEPGFSGFQPVSRQKMSFVPHEIERFQEDPHPLDEEEDFGYANDRGGFRGRGGRGDFRGRGRGDRGGGNWRGDRGGGNWRGDRGRGSWRDDRGRGDRGRNDDGRGGRGRGSFRPSNSFVSAARAAYQDVGMDYDEVRRQQRDEEEIERRTDYGGGGYGGRKEGRGEYSSGGRQPPWRQEDGEQSKNMYSTRYNEASPPSGHHVNVETHPQWESNEINYSPPPLRHQMNVETHPQWEDYSKQEEQESNAPRQNNISQDSSSQSGYFASFGAVAKPSGGYTAREEKPSSTKTRSGQQQQPCFSATTFDSGKKRTSRFDQDDKGRTEQSHSYAASFQSASSTSRNQQMGQTGTDTSTRSGFNAPRNPYSSHVTQTNPEFSPVQGRASSGQRKLGSFYTSSSPRAGRVASGNTIRGGSRPAVSSARENSLEFGSPLNRMRR